MITQADVRNNRQWSSRLTFFFAMVGASIGLGNLWRFPYVAGENGGGAFIIVYLAIILIVCVPLVMAELAMGRRGDGSPITSLIALINQGGHRRFWVVIGWLSTLTPLITLTFYAVVAGWSLDYIYHAVQGRFVNISAGAAGEQFAELLASPLRLVFWSSLYLAATVYIVGKGIKKGIESVTSFMMPALFVMIVLLVIYGHIEGDPAAAWEFMFLPDFSRLTWQSMLEALGQALFSISVGTGALLTYGAYLARDMRIVGPSCLIAGCDTLAALLAGLAIFPIVFVAGLDPTSGPGLMFETLPLALGHMPGGHFFSTLFFVLVFFAAFSSSLAMLEPFIAYLEDKGYRRLKMTALTGSIVWLISLASVLSFNHWEDIKPLAFIPLYAGKSVFGIIEYSVSSILLPLTAFLIAVFAGWVMSHKLLRQEIGIKSDQAYRLWDVLTRYPAVLGVGCVLVFGLL